MDFFHKLKVLFLFFLTVVISACSETKSASTPEILGVPSNSALVDVVYEYEFGADGGDGLLSYSILSGPSWLNIENLNGAKPRFRIFGVPEVGDRTAFNEFLKQNVEIVLGVTDGGLSSTQSYEFVLEKNVLQFDQKTWDVLEGTTTPTLDPEDFSEDCELPSMTPREVNGKTAYPYPITLTLDAPAETEVKLHYIVTSDYDEALEERAIANLRQAKPNSDYVNKDGVFIMKPGVTKCAFAIDLYDDDILEGAERLRVTFDEILSGWVVYPEVTVIEIGDSEPEVSFDGGATTMTFTETRDFSFTLASEIDYPVSMKVYVDNKNAPSVTAADYEISILGTVCNASYVFSDNTCVLTFPPNTTESKFSVTVKDDGAFTSGDELLVIRSPVSNIYKLDALQISINEWASDVTVSSSIGGAGVIAGGLEVDTDGNVITLLQSEIVNSDVSVTLNRRDGSTSSKFLASGDAVLASADLKADFFGGISYRQSGTHYIGVALMTEGAFTGFANPNSKKDVVVQLYARPSGGANYAANVNWPQQFGTDEDDVVNGVIVDSAASVFVYGYTEGEFDAAQPYMGQRDAFISKFDLLGNHKWTRQVGSVGNEEIVGLQFVSGVIYAVGITDGVLGEGSLGGQDGFLLKLDGDGVVSSTVQFGTSENDVVTGLASMRTELWISGHTNGSVEVDKDGIANASAIGSIDTFFLASNLDGKITRSLQFGDANEDEVSSTIRRLGDWAYVGATTPGEYEPGKNLGGVDAVISSVNSDDGVSAVSWHKQFGTNKDDRLIDLDVYSDNKVFALWETDDNAGNLTYKLSPFSVEGVKLTP